MASPIIDLISQEAADLKEKILVVDSDAVPSESGVVSVTEEELYKLISEHGSYQVRNAELEQDTRYKQIIPYSVVRREDKYLFTYRTDKGGERRLLHKGVVAFGGHVKAEDVEGQSLESWGERELDEELQMEKIETISYKALINDDSGGVSDFHLGVLVVVDVGNFNVGIREKDKFLEPEWLTLDELWQKASEMETWSSLVVNSGLI